MAEPDVVPVDVTTGEPNELWRAVLSRQPGTLAWFALARGQRGIFVVMLMLVIGMGPFRIVDGAHWPSDVLAGYALGLAWTIVVLVLGTPWATSGEAALAREHDDQRAVWPPAVSCMPACGPNRPPER